ncbi:endosomal peripheral membrane protein-like protein [Aulographum hederae CBS 113979]|uniref:Endosomal peripheral membrane protein-like protein n=1 Tax=Aulographum hederae CBS 113979 TaxID=1176131 RepID=A0A6G1GJL4_9PEZI|nr:endosomal peripheral membrane protein-like protein [Aulographum hederae CBS 113979]
MTAHILSSELSNLVQESKRKNTELRNAADKSLQDLKALPTTSENQLAADLSRRPHFITPFLIACGTKNPKFAAIATVCLQRLVVSKGLPRERLKDVVEAFGECSSLGTDIQLKILQALPSLFQNYSNELRSDLLFAVLQVCSSLQASKAVAVSSTAAATLQQLVISVFDKLEIEDGKALEVPTIGQVPTEEGPVAVRPVAQDAFKIFHDLCLLIDGAKLQYIHFSAIPLTSGLELVESILSNHADIFLTHPEQASILHATLLPFIIRSLSERLSFPTTLRVMRISSFILRNHLSILPAECEIILGLLNHMLDPEAAPPWKRAICMEVFRSLYAESDLVLEIHATYDMAEGKKPVLRENLAAFVRLATEKPTVIGLSHQSTTPVGQSSSRDAPTEQAAVEATAVADLIGGGGMDVNTSNVMGISSQWSSPRTACLDQLDKADAPQTPETYVYSLVLSCLNSLSETLAKFILPLTVHTEGKSKRHRSRSDTGGDSKMDEDRQGEPNAQSAGLMSPRADVTRSQSFRKRTVPINPVTLARHPAYSGIKAVVALIDECWPAILACCSTFLYAALDAEYYRALVRSFQRFTQVSGLLRMSTARDAFLTTLSKAAVPPNVLAASLSPAAGTPVESPSMFSNARGLLSVESITKTPNLSEKSRTSADLHMPTLTTRNLLCLRALLNLAIALGPTMDAAWAIVLETLQQADIITMAWTSRDKRNIDSSYVQSLNSEISAVMLAAERLFESTVDYTNESFIQMLMALCNLLREKESSSQPIAPQSPGFMKHQRRVGSFSGLHVNIEAQTQDYQCALKRIDILATLNLSRFAGFEEDESGWSLLMGELIALSTKVSIAADARNLAAATLSHVVHDLTSSASSEPPEAQNDIHCRAIAALLTEVQALYDTGNFKDTQHLVDDIDLKVHYNALAALKAIVEHCGERLTSSWAIVFDLVLSAFRPHELRLASANLADAIPRIHLFSKGLGRISFDCVQLMCSDFLPTIPTASLLVLIDTLFRFSLQEDDLNIALTTTTFFWKVSDFLQSSLSSSSFADLIEDRSETTQLLEHVQTAARASSIPALWLYLLLRMISVTADPRPEVRNAAIHTLLRIFDHYGEHLSPSDWELCIEAILLRMLSTVVHHHQRLASEDVPTEELAAWDETSTIMLDGLSGLISTYLDEISRCAEFSKLWETFMILLEDLLACKIHALHVAVFTAITKMLSKITKPAVIGQAAIDKLTDMWTDNFPRTSPRSHSESNQPVFEAYVGALKEIYRLTEARVELEFLKKAVENLVQCVQSSDCMSYTNDLDRMAPLQSRVVDSLGLFKTNIKGSMAVFVQGLAVLIGLPYATSTPEPRKGSLTYVAISKAAMDRAKRLIASSTDLKDLVDSPALLKTVQSLRQATSSKTQLSLQGKEPTSYKLAVKNSLDILAKVLPDFMEASTNRKNLISFWTQVLDISNDIARFDCDIFDNAFVEPPALEEEDFDMASLTTLRNLIVPALGSRKLPDSLRRTYTANIFTNSLIHSPEPGELPPNIHEEPLQDFYKIRFGRTCDPEPTFRSRMSYLCLSELLSLTAAPQKTSSLLPSHRNNKEKSLDGEANHVKLAQAASPYLILRAALPIKAYIADAPLRGRMPMPASEKAELVFVSREMRGLETEPRAIPDVPGVVSQRKKHLHRLYKIVVSAVGVATKKGDEEVVRALEEVLEAVGEEFGL